MKAKLVTMPNALINSSSSSSRHVNVSKGHRRLTATRQMHTRGTRDSKTYHDEAPRRRQFLFSTDYNALSFIAFGIVTSIYMHILFLVREGCGYDSSEFTPVRTGSLDTNWLFRNRCNPHKYMERNQYVAHVGKSMYALQLKRWIDLFGRDSMKVRFFFFAREEKALLFISPRTISTMSLGRRFFNITFSITFTCRRRYRGDVYVVPPP